MKKQPSFRTLLDTYRLPGHRARKRIDFYDLEPPALAITYDLRQNKRRHVTRASNARGGFMIGVGSAHAISIAAFSKSISIFREAA